MLLIIVFYYSTKYTTFCSEILIPTLCLLHVLYQQDWETMTGQALHAFLQGGFWNLDFIDSFLVPSNPQFGQKIETLKKSIIMISPLKY